MKTTLAITLSISTMLSFFCTYFLKITMSNAEQYIALLAVVFIDGFFGIIAGIKREGFQTRKALKVIRTAIVWLILLTTILLIEQGFQGTSWLSETILVPFIIFQLISALKNASMIGWIKADILNIILDKIDNHKGLRK